MKKTPLILSILLVVTLGLGYFIYHKIYSKEQLKIWDIIPLQTVLVYEVGECTECLEQIEGTPIWIIFKELFFRDYSVGRINKLTANILDAKNRSIVSLHIVKKDDFDFVFYLPKDRANQIELQLEELGIESNRFSQREFNGIQINELPVDDRLFSWVTIEDIWVGSFTPFLVEDVIRTYKSDRSLTFKNQITDVSQFPTVKNDAGNFYISLKGLSEWLSVFVDNQKVVSALGQASVLDIKLNTENLTLNGFSTVRIGAENTILSNLSGQSPVPFALKGFISNRSLAVNNYGISDGALLYKNLELFKRKDVQDSIQLFAKIDFSTLFSGLGNELVTCFMESSGMPLSRVLLFSSSNSQEWLKAFDLLSRASEREDSVYLERYSMYEIRQIEIYNLPEKLFKPLVNGFKRTYYTSIGSTIVLSDRVEELRRFLDDIDKEEVWGKSVSYNQFLESTLLEANYSLYINMSRALNAISSHLNTKWSKVYSSTNRSYLNALGLSAIQFSHLNQSFYTNMSWSFSPQKDFLQNREPEVRDRIQVNLDQGITSEPFVVRNHTSKRNEYVLQDSLTVLHYFSTDGKRQWKKELQQKFIGGITQIDYLNNNKLQLFLVSAGKLHVIDRLGNYVDPFPVTISQQNIEFVSVIDYDNSKKYRFLLADKAGKLWMFDQAGKNLEGWKPRNVDGPLVAAPNHYRVRGKDFILALRQDGWVYLMNRRGENIKGFPVNLDVRPGGTYFLEPGNTLENTNFVIVSKDGIKIKLNLEGKVVTREPLIRTLVDDQFSIVVEKNSQSYLVARQNAKELTLLDENGKVILTNPFLGRNLVDIQYYSFGSGNVYIVVSDKVQDLSYVYDGFGKLLTPVPLEATGVSLKQEGQKTSVVIVNGRSFTILPLVE